MAERPQLPHPDQVERALMALGEALAYPPNAHMAEAVQQRLTAEAARGRHAQGVARRHTVWPPRSLAERLVAALLLLLALLGGLLAASPGARAALADWLRLRGIVIFFQSGPPPRPPAPLGTHLLLGRRTSLAAAQRSAPFHIVIPHDRTAGQPDEIYVGEHGGGVQIGLIYRTRTGIPRIGKTKIGLLLTETPGNAAAERVFAFKSMPYGARLEIVKVAGATGYWLTGQPHMFFYTNPNGIIATDTIRLAGHTLLWQRGDVVVRLESSLDKPAALRLAASVR